MENKTTSREAIKELKENAQEICKWELDRLIIIEKDLEVLEILKRMLTVEKGSTWYYLDTKHPFFEKQEDIDKVKEWLENEN